MHKTLFTLALLAAVLQGANRPKVKRGSVNTPHETSIVYAYAGAAFPQDEPLKERAVDCFVSELKATGLYTDVRVTLEPADDT